METEKKEQTVNHIDYKNIMKLKSLANPHARMHGRRRTGLTAHQQRVFAQATKRARFMALTAYVNY